MAATRRDRFTSRPRAAARFVAQRMILKPVVWGVTKVTVVGKARARQLPDAFVVVANHSSHLDAPLIICGLPYAKARNLSTGAAADYFFDVWWRRGLTTLFFNAFPIDRGGGHRRPTSAKVLLQRGVPLLVFPEGTRSKDGGRTMGHFKPGAAALASSADVPCLPVAIVGAGRAHPRGSKWPGPGRLPVGVVFGEPMYAEPGEAPPAFMQRVKAEIERLLAEHSPRILGSASKAEGAP